MEGSSWHLQLPILSLLQGIWESTCDLLIGMCWFCLSCIYLPPTTHKNTLIFLEKSHLVHMIVPSPESTRSISGQSIFSKTEFTVIGLRMNSWLELSNRNWTKHWLAEAGQCCSFSSDLKLQGYKSGFASTHHRDRVWELKKTHRKAELRDREEIELFEPLSQISLKNYPWTFLSLEQINSLISVKCFIRK